jgi:hypothetical protein
MRTVVVRAANVLSDRPPGSMVRMCVPLAEDRRAPGICAGGSDFDDALGVIPAFAALDDCAAINPSCLVGIQNTHAGRTAARRYETPQDVCLDRVARAWLGSPRAARHRIAIDTAAVVWSRVQFHWLVGSASCPREARCVPQF